jgi:glyceraldehyde 3-phosphate dehydrogenase
MGRIGRQVLKFFSQERDFEVVAVNDLMDIDTLFYLLKYDSVYGKFADIELIDRDCLQIGKSRVRVFENLKELDLEVELFIEATGVITSLSKDIQRVILTFPTADESIRHFVYGVNHSEYTNERVISNSSCTVNAIAHTIDLLQRHFGIESGFLSTIHSYTSEQSLLDSAKNSNDLTLNRASTLNIIPRETGAISVLQRVVPSIEGKFQAQSFRVNSIIGSVAQLNINLQSSVSRDELISFFYKFANREILSLEDNYKVSTDFKASAYSSTLALRLIQVNGNFITLSLWFDNEFAYSKRVVDLSKHII